MRRCTLNIKFDNLIFDLYLKANKILKQIREIFPRKSAKTSICLVCRNAQNFIYIENQYFYGSSYMWDCLNKPSCHHIIPSEIAHKIASQIRNHKRFVAYIVVPMFPEGDPASGPLQEILNYQHKTMEMMYKIIASALNEVGSRQEPKDYLFFLCPAKREGHDTHMATLEKPIEGVDTPMAVKLRESLRCPIYVHSKMMIVDDVYIIVGSANINQRSMAGTRDTEIAVSGRQDQYGIDNPSGNISAFRKSLFNSIIAYCITT